MAAPPLCSRRTAGRCRSPGRCWSTRAHPPQAWAASTPSAARAPWPRKAGAWSTFPATSRFPQMASAETPTGPWASSTAAWGMAEPRMSRRMTAPFCSAVALRSMHKASAAAAQVPLVAVRETRAGQAGVAARFSMPCRVEAFRWSASPRFRQAGQAAMAARVAMALPGWPRSSPPILRPYHWPMSPDSRAEQARTDRGQTGLAVRARGGVSSFSPKALAISR